MAGKAKTHFNVIKNSWERDEYIKCYKSPMYFIMNYVKIPHPMRGDIPFELYPFQMSLLYIYLRYRFSVTLKPRQMGISMLVAAYALWLANFRPHKYVLIVSIKQSTARSLLRRVKYMYSGLPEFLQTPVKNGKAGSVGTADEIMWVNGSEIKTTGSTDNAGRSDALSCLIIDEAAFQAHAGTTWGAAQPTLSTGGQAIVLSTAFGVGNFFHKLYSEAIEGVNGFFPVRLKWQDHPERNWDWYYNQVRTLGTKRVAQEIDCNFLQSGYNVFELAAIREIEDRLRETKPLETRLNGQLQIYHRPQPGMDYFVGSDIASGRARDYSSFSIFDVNGVEAACFKGKIIPNDFAYLLGDIGYEYNTALLAPEVNNMGHSTVSVLQENHYPNLYHHLSKIMKLNEFERSINEVPGWLTTGKTRHEIITTMDNDLLHGNVQMWNPFFAKEAMTFVYNENNKPIALGKDKGKGGIRSSSMYEDDTSVVYTDDAIIGACIGNEIRQNKLYRAEMPISAG